MEGTRRDPAGVLGRLIVMCSLLGAIALAGLAPLRWASADDGFTPRPDRPKANVSVTSSSSGVTIYVAVSQTSPGSSGSSSSASTGGGGSSGWSCSASIMNIGNASRAWFEQEAPLHPDQAPWMVRCTNGFISVVWLPINTDPSNVSVAVTTGGSVDPSIIAAELRDHVPVPPITVGANPALGLVAMPSWFWVEGYDGATIRASDGLEGVTVEVEIAPAEYRWNFGDGATIRTTSLGQPYPVESDIRHTYEQSSLSTGGTFGVTLEVTFSAHYRVNGGPVQPLEPIIRTFTLPYAVQQLQSILTGR